MRACRWVSDEVGGNRKGLWKAKPGEQVRATTVTAAESRRLRAAVTAYLNREHVPGRDDTDLEQFPLAEELLQEYDDILTRQREEN